MSAPSLKRPRPPPNEIAYKKLRTEVREGDDGPQTGQNAVVSKVGPSVQAKPGSGQKQHKCLECGDVFNKRHQLRSHAASAHAAVDAQPSLPFACEHVDCAKVFESASKLRQHQRTHEEDRYLCTHPDCQPLEDESRFPNWNALQQHIKAEHKPKQPVPSSREASRGSSAAVESPKDTSMLADSSPLTPVRHPCPQSGCSFIGRKESLLERHLAKAHQLTLDGQPLAADDPALVVMGMADLAMEES